MSDSATTQDLLDRWEAARAKGQAIAVDELCKSSPQLIERVASQVRALEATDWLLNDDEDEAGYLSLDSVHYASTECFIPKESSLNKLKADLVSSGLFSEKQLSPYEKTSNAIQLVSQLLRDKKLTRFQAKRIAESRVDELVLGNYIIVETIGAGGMGQVFKAVHKRMDRVVALKVLPPKAAESSQLVARFHREVMAAAKLSHPNVVQAFDADEANGVHFLVMECVDGKDLFCLVRKRGPLSLRSAVRCVIQAARGLEYAHSQGVIHRDIKPGNLLLDADHCIKVLDMGLARIEDSVDGAHGESQLTEDGAVFGTVDYLPPEQAIDSHKADARSDIYSLGCTLHYLVTGRPPYSGATLMAKALAHRDAEIPSLDHAELNCVFQRMLAKDPNERQQSMSELVTALTKVVQTLPISPDDLFVSSGPLAVDDRDEAVRETDAQAFAETAIMAPAISVDSKSKQHRRKTKRTTSMGWRFWATGGTSMLLLFAGVLGVLYWAGLIFRVAVPGGVIQVESNVADIEIYVDGENAVFITNPDDGRKISVHVPKGASTLRVEKDGFEADASRFDLKTTKGLIRVTFTPTKRKQLSSPFKPIAVLASSDLAERHRQVAEMVLKAGGQVDVWTGSNETSRTCRNVSELPSRRFCIQTIRILSEESNKHANDIELWRAIGQSQFSGNSEDTTSLQIPASDDAMEVFVQENPRFGANLLLIGGSLSDAGVDHISRLKDLNTLEIEGERITDVSIGKIRLLPSLRHLAIWNSNITSEGISILAEHASLQSLDLKGTQSDFGKALAEFRKTPNLQVLRLRGCSVSDEHANALMQLKSLRLLDLFEAKVSQQVAQRIQTELRTCLVIHESLPISRIEQQVISLPSKTASVDATWVAGKGIKAITVHGDLDLSGLFGLRNLVVSPGSNVHGVSQAESLAFISNLQSNADDEWLRQVTRLPQLEMLNVASHAITDDGIRGLQGLKYLRRVSLKSNRLSDRSLAYLADLPSLKKISIGYAAIKDDGFAALANSTQLHHLHLHHAPTSDHSITFLKELKHLRTLSLAETKITPKGAAELQQALPNCIVLHEGLVRGKVGVKSGDKP